MSQCCATAPRTFLVLFPFPSGTAGPSGCRATVSSAPFDFRNGPGIGLQTHTAVFAAVAVATAGVSTTEVEVHAIRATCTAFAVVAIATTGVVLDSRTAVYAGVAIIIATTGVSRDYFFLHTVSAHVLSF